MKQLNPFQNFLYALGGLLLVIGAAFPIISNGLTLEAALLFTSGTVLFGSMQLMASYSGDSVIVRRLRRQQIFGIVFLFITAGLMFAHLYGFSFARADQWVVTLCIATIFQAYTAFRLPAALEKDEKK